MKKLILFLTIIVFNATNMCLADIFNEGFCPKNYPNEITCKDDSECLPFGLVCNPRWNGKVGCSYKACGKKGETTTF